MPVPKILKGRYETREVLGRGGMGVVYKGFDTVVKRDVALKTILDIADREALALFHKEYEVLASISHPNIVEIFDLGEYEEGQESVPYFVMPLLNGTTLDQIIRTASHRLTIERSVDIISQTCRGLQAAHEHGLVHRDMKPSNIFVMEDDSVRIIDFGVVHKSNHHTTKGLKGTLLYMSPELIEMKGISPLSDVFSLGVVAYETLTQRKPFDRGSQYDIIQAILHYVPPAASEINPAVSQTVSRVVHKAMAKQPYHRFSTVRELAETLQKALRNEPIEIFDPARIQPRIQRAGKAYDQGDYQFADEILRELEAEGHIDSAMSLLRRQIDVAVRQKRIQQLLESARTRLDEKEYPLALQKVQQILELEPDHSGALALKHSIETMHTEDKVEDWFRLVRQHIDNHAYSHARQALENVLQLNPSDTRARQIKAEIDQKEEDYLARRQEKEQLYQSAVDAWQRGEVSSALLKLERALDLDRQVPDSSGAGRSSNYQTFYNQVRSEHDLINTSYAEAQRYLTDREFSKALAICNDYLAKYPGNALFQALMFDVEERQRQELSRFIAVVDNQIEAEPDLDKRVNILKEALSRYPEEGHFEHSLRIMREKRDLVASIVAKAHLYEERGAFSEALGQWEILETIYDQYPGLKVETDRLIKRRLQQEKQESKAKVVSQVDRQLHLGNYATVLELLQKAAGEFPDDDELASLGNLARQGVERTAEAARLLERGQSACSQRRYEEGISLLRQARQLDEGNPAIRAALINSLVEKAQFVLDSDWRAAEDAVRQALELDPTNTQGKSLRTLAQDRKRNEFVGECVSRARQLQAGGDPLAALKEVEAALASYPEESRLTQLKATLKREIDEAHRRDTRRKSLDELGQIGQEAETVADLGAVQSLTGRLKVIAQRAAADPEVRSVAAGVEARLYDLVERLEREAAVPPPPEPGTTPGLPSLSAAAQPAAELEGQTMGFGGGKELAAGPPAVPPAASEQAELAEERTIIFRRGQALAGTPPTSPPAAPAAPVAAPPEATATEDQTLLFRGAKALREAVGQPAQAKPPASAATPSEAAPPALPPPPKPQPQATPPAPVPGPTAAKPAAAVPPGPPATPPARKRAAVQPKPPLVPPFVGPPGASDLEQTKIREAPRIEMLAPPEVQPVPKKAAPWLVVALVGILGAGLVGVGAYFGLKHMKLRAVGPTVSLEVRTSPPGAGLILNGESRGVSNLRLDLPPGTYNLKADLAGYQPQSTTLQVKVGAPASIDLTLQPLPNTFRLYTDLQAGSVHLDGNTVGELQDGQLVLDSVSPGKHSVSVSGRYGEAAVEFEADAGSVPTVSSPVVARELKVVVFSNLGSHGRLYASYGPIKANLDGQPVGDAGPAGLDLENLARGSHELLLGEGQDQRKLVIESGPAPALTAFLSSDRNVGTLVVVTGEDNVRVLIDGREFRRRTQRGQVRIPNLEVKTYNIRVVKDGYQLVEVQQAEVRKGGEVKVEFHLVPVPSVASLQLQGVLPGAQVVVDQKVLGSVRDDGVFSASGIAPGEHTIEIRKEQYRTKRIVRSFAAGETVKLGENEVALEAGLGVVHLSVSPADTQVTVARVGEAQSRPVRETTLNLPEGTYILKATAPSHAARSVTLHVAAGETKTVDLSLTAESKGDTSDWEQPESWSRDGNWLVRRGGGVALFRTTPTAGRFVMTLALRRGRRLQWVLNYTDDRNYVVFQTDKKTFYRSVVQNGVTKELARVPMGVDYKGYYTLQMRVTANAVTHEVFDGKGWVTIDSWTDPGRNLASGKFGLLAPGSEEIGVSNFAFYPQ
jgi:serine/threonine-protein kinase